MLRLFYSEKTNRIYRLLPEFSNYTTLQPFFSSYRHIHPVYHIVFILNGKGFLESECGKNNLSPGDIILINPDERHIFSTLNEPLVYYAVNFRLQCVNQILSEQTAESLKLQQILDIKAEKIYLSYNTMVWENIKSEIKIYHLNLTEYENRLVFEHPGYWKLNKLSNHIFDFVSNIYAKYLCADVKYVQQQMRHPLIMKIISYLRNHMNENLALGPMSEELGYNASYISRIFKNKVSIPISEYFLRLKIQKSCELIRMTEKSITEIALELGFSSSQHFSRTFKSLKKVSPGEFRKNTELY